MITWAEPAASPVTSLPMPVAGNTIAFRQTNSFLLPRTFDELGTNLLRGLTNNPTLRSNLFEAYKALKLAREDGLKPGGVYLTKPYSMIVRVPNRMKDEAMVHVPGRALSMPGRVPGLEFLPKEAPKQD